MRSAGFEQSLLANQLILELQLGLFTPEQLTLNLDRDLSSGGICAEDFLGGCYWYPTEIFLFPLVTIQDSWDHLFEFI